MRVFKYDLPWGGVENISMPKNAKILTVQQQEDKLVLWALVNPNLTPTEEQRTFHICYTGQKVPNNSQYIGTVQYTPTEYIYHVFEQGIIEVGK